MNILRIAASILLVAPSLSGCVTGPRPIPVSEFSAAPYSNPRAFNWRVVNEAGRTPRRSETVVSDDVSEWYEPRFNEAIAVALGRYLGSRTSGASGLSVVATVKNAKVTVERGGVDFMPGGAVIATLRERTFVASGSILFEVERDGKVERSYLLTHSVRVPGRLTTDEQRGASVAKAIDQWRTEAFEK